MFGLVLQSLMGIPVWGMVKLSSVSGRVCFLISHPFFLPLKRESQSPLVIFFLTEELFCSGDPLQRSRMKASSYVIRFSEMKLWKVNQVLKALRPWLGL